MSTTDNFYNSKEWQLGDSTQKLFAEILVKNNRVVLPTYGMSDVSSIKAPVLFCLPEFLIAPDILSYKKDQGSTWIDMKAKSKPVWHRNEKRWKHGVDYSLALQYRQVETETETPMLMVVFECASPTNPDSDGDLVPASRWLFIRLKDAFKLGEHRQDWPGGKSDPSRRGKGGLGGLLWARNLMGEIVVDNESLEIIQIYDRPLKEEFKMVPF